MKRFPAIPHGHPPTRHAALQTKEPRPSGGAASFAGRARRYYLKPGEMFIGEESALVETVLGSCVAIAIFSPRYLIGTLSHSMLPSCGKAKSPVENCSQGARFVDWSLHCMLDWFLRRGALRQELVVKVFGGSEMFTGAEGNVRVGVGRQNIESALQIIEQEGLYLAAFDLGGDKGRKIFFKTNTGEIFLKRLNQSELMR
jgi:chemotaxis protein CheD